MNKKDTLGRQSCRCSFREGPPLAGGWDKDRPCPGAGDGCELRLSLRRRPDLE